MLLFETQIRFDYCPLPVQLDKASIMEGKMYGRRATDFEELAKSGSKSQTILNN